MSTTPLTVLYSELRPGDVIVDGFGNPELQVEQVQVLGEFVHYSGHRVGRMTRRAPAGYFTVDVQRPTS